MSDSIMKPRGWIQIRSGGCHTETVTPNSPRYVFAESAPIHMGRIREWKGKVKLCASSEDFSADATRSCALQDLETRDYLQVDPSERNTTFIEPDNFSENAVTAGIQRLLRDNGYQISRIDGLPGRRTSRQMDRFLKDNDLPRTTTIGQRFDALIKGARDRQDKIGLKVCNKSTALIWTAVASRNKADWESRGWWPITPEECARPITDSLEKTDTHIYAVQEQPLDEDENPVADKYLRTIAAKPTQFCIAEGIFSALGNELCVDRGYEAVNFRALPTDIDGTTVTLTDADFTTPNATGLRR